MAAEVLMEGVQRSARDLQRIMFYRLKPHDERNECAVCLEHMSTCLVTPCGHLFHCRCLRKHMRYRANCPMCRTELDHDPDSDDEFDLDAALAVYPRSFLLEHVLRTTQM
jgi:hypothetical protein